MGGPVKGVLGVVAGNPLEHDMEAGFVYQFVGLVMSRPT